MSLTLSPEDVTRLQSALTSLLSPLDSTTLDGWGIAPKFDRAMVQVAPHEPDIWSLQLLLPAFEAGAQTDHLLNRRREALLRLLDTIEAGLAIFDARGGMLHQTAALGSLLGGDAEAHRIQHQLPCVALAVSDILRGRTGALEPIQPVCREVHTSMAGYRLRGIVFGEALLGSEVTIAVGVERVTSKAVSDQMLMERHSLTQREVEVARHLGHGDSSREIAQSLGISRYTARHHTENVMRKLDVHSRAAVAARLMMA